MSGGVIIGQEEPFLYFIHWHSQLQPSDREGAGQMVLEMVLPQTRAHVCQRRLVGYLKWTNRHKHSCIVHHTCWECMCCQHIGTDTGIKESQRTRTHLHFITPIYFSHVLNQFYWFTVQCNNTNGPKNMHPLCVQPGSHCITFSASLGCDLLNPIFPSV